ncbi:PVC-type heme-binding CxxCH protein [Planctomyces sp. SH-PL62]|uniref:PVC-type heme-binding CxxCH protein n=1 Tax=Planctomyces sp. SH-PL62 TaxID=1636152 RepID=UPI00078D49C0|nr:PVC-type heme-binding CxxCH protein [Planctomyces sp. SH-PL62]AMV36276.1 Cytochrome c [Planctomyces sp. SH-PL62]
MEPLATSPRRRAALALVGACLALAPAALHAQTGPEESARKLKPADGLEATLWAAEPLLFNPTSLDVDSRGRVWVAEGLNYRLTRGGNKKFARVEESDKIKILEDADGDGKADKVTVFADRIFPVPMGLAVEERYDEQGKYLGCRVYVGNSPNLLVLEDTDGDDKADKRYPLLTGFGGLDSDHGIHGVTLGLDGKLYFTHGDGCCSVQEDRSERYQNFDVVDKSGRHVVADKYANTLRVNRDGTEFEVVCDGQRNNYETCRDAFGNGFTSDNDDDGNRGCRVIHTMDGGRFGYKTPGSPRHWGEDVPGNVPKLVGTGNGSPCGIAVYEGRLLPGYFGGLLEAEAGTRQINFFPLTRRGASFGTEYRVMLSSDDPWFRPVDMTAAPDGSVFVADWYDAGVGGHAFADQDTGRIYRVAPVGVGPKAIKPDFASIAGLIEGLKSPCVATQDAARRSLIARGDAAADAVSTLIREGTPEESARAIWTASAIPRLAGIAAEILKRPGDFHGGDPRFRELAVRMLGRDCRENGIVEYQNPEARKPAPALAHLDLLLPLADDPDAGVRRELLLALRKAPTPQVGDALRKLVTAWDGRDRWYLEALGLALDGREAEFVTGLMDPSLFGGSDDFEKLAGDDRVALPPYFPVDRNEAFIPAGAAEPEANALSKLLGFLWRLQRPEALPLLEQILPKLKGPGLQQAGDDVLQRIRSPFAADVAALMAEQSDDPVRRRILLELLASRLAGPWREAKDRPPVLRVIEAALGRPEWRRQGIAMAAATGDGRYRGTLERIALDPKQPEETAAAAVEAVGAIDVTPNRVLEDLIAAHHGAPASDARAEAAVRTLPKLYDARSRLLGILTDRAYPVSLRREAVRTLARLPEGGLRLVDLARDGKLLDDLKTEATTAIHGLGDPRVREAAAAVLPPPSTAGGRPLPPIAELLRREGDPARGEQVFFRQGSESCGSCHRVQGRGHWVGPDLSTVGVKYGRGELLNSVLNPSSAISYNFRSVVLALTDGRILTGLPVEESPQRIVIKTAEGDRVVVPIADIEERRSSEVSLMPENLASTMTDGELVDLIAYLGTLRRPVGVVGRYQVVGPIAEAGGAPAFDPTARVDLEAAVADGTGRSLTWRRIEADAEGRADLQPFLPAGEKGAVFAHTPIVSPTAQKATLVLDAQAEVAAWLDGRPVSLSKAGEGAPSSAELDLPAGRGSLLIRVASGGKTDAAAIVATIVAEQPVAFDASGADAPAR